MDISEKMTKLTIRVFEKNKFLASIGEVTSLQTSVSAALRAKAIQITFRM